MNQRLTHYLALLAIFFYILTPATAHAQVLKGTFAAGHKHSLSIHADGSLWASGNNDDGQLGNGIATIPNTSTTGSGPWQPVGTATNWLQVAAGYDYSLGLRVDGTLWAWGNNSRGQLGTASNVGTATPLLVPTQVGSGYVQVGAGYSHSLGLKADGSLWAWGTNYYGELGNTTNDSTLTPNPVPAQVPGTYVQLAVGFDHSLALKADGSLWAWGDNYSGALGNSIGAHQYASHPTPTQVPGIYIQIAAGGGFSLALKADGSLWAWGNNYYGQLGNTTNNYNNYPNSTPTQVPGFYTRIAAGYTHSLGLRADGTLWSWGDNHYGQLGNTSNVNSGASVNPTPALLPGIYVQAVAGDGTTLALRADGTLWGCGFNIDHQLGTIPLGGTLANPTPTAVNTALPTRSTASNFYAGYAIKGDGTLWSWGDNGFGQLGDGTTTGRLRPAQLGTDRDWVQVVAGSGHALALKANGTAWAWGLNSANQVNNTMSPSIPVPLQVSGLTFTNLAAGANFNLARTATGQLYAWGANTHLQLGVGSTAATVPVPLLVSGGLTWVSMAAGGEFSLGLTDTGQAYGWGYNLFGQTGTPVSSTSTNEVAAPTLIANVPVLRQVSAGYVYSLGLAATGTAYGWGLNSAGQLGVPTNSGTTAPNATPLAITGVAPLRQVEGYSGHSLGLTAAGTIYSWGYNASGMLAQGTFGSTAAPVPTQEITLATGWAQLGTGSSAITSLVRTNSGLAFASAGDNSYGQLGDGTTTNWPRFDRMSPLTSLQALPVLGATGGMAFALAPNPARTQATAVGLPAGSTLAVYDALGRLVVTTGSLTFSVAGLPTGLYVVRATAPGQAAQSARLVVE